MKWERYWVQPLLLNEWKDNSSQITKKTHKKGKLLHTIIIIRQDTLHNTHHMTRSYAVGLGKVRFKKKKKSSGQQWINGVSELVMQSCHQGKTAAVSQGHSKKKVKEHRRWWHYPIKILAFVFLIRKKEVREHRRWWQNITSHGSFSFLWDDLQLVMTLSWTI